MGWLWERKMAPSLPGALPGIPLRPIYGLGAALAGDNLSKNCIVSAGLESIGHTANPELWNYDVGKPTVISPAVDAENMLGFGIAMTAADAVLSKLGI